MQALRREFMIGSTKTASWLCFCSWTVEGKYPRKCKKQLWTSHLLEHFLVFNFLVMVGKKIKSCSYCLAAQVARGLLELTCQVSTFFLVHRDTHLLWVFADVGLIRGPIQLMRAATWSHWKGSKLGVIEARGKKKTKQNNGDKEF